MSRERDLLARVLTSELWSVQEELQAEIKQLLAQPEQEPVAWMQDSIELYVLEEKSVIRGYVIPLYTAPPPREPLSEKEIVNLWANKSPANEFECVRLGEKAHGITGGK